MLEDVLVALVEHAPAAASRIIERSSALGVEDAHHQLHDPMRRVELAGFLAGRVRKLTDQVFVGAKQVVID